MRRPPSTLSTHPSAGMSLALPHTVTPAWIALTEDMPLMCELTPNNGHLIVGPHPYSVGEKTCCEHLSRCGDACALAMSRPLHKGNLDTGLVPLLHLDAHEVRLAGHRQWRTL